MLRGSGIGSKCWLEPMERDGPWFCYMLECRDQSLYIGTAKDPAQRAKRHNWGIGARHTGQRRPVKLIWQEEHADEASARRREAELKGWRREKNLALVAALRAKNPSPKNGSG